MKQHINSLGFSFLVRSDLKNLVGGKNRCGDSCKLDTDCASAYGCYCDSSRCTSE
ncbi:MAG: hypothetical protein QM528_08570 [Phycisphaerales bacterium]|nr:hypothetical protein [Phycisphaerales bacterium]